MPAASRLGGERSGGQRVRRWFVLSAMCNGRSISKLTGRNISLSSGGEVS